MPPLVLITNVKVPDVKEFVLDFSKVSAKILDKPEKYISINYNYDPYLTFGGTFEPALLLNIISLDNINPESNLQYSAAFFKYLKEKLDVPGDRGYIYFNDPGRAYIGHNGTTFDTIFKKT